MVNENSYAKTATVDPNKLLVAGSDESLAVGTRSRNGVALWNPVFYPALCVLIRTSRRASREREGGKDSGEKIGADFGARGPPKRN